MDLSDLSQMMIQCDLNIKAYEDAIAKEIRTKLDYQAIVLELEAQQELDAQSPPISKKRKKGFDLGAMRQAVIKCDINVSTFQKAIEKENNTKLESQKIIRELEFQEAQKKIVIDAKAISTDKNADVDDMDD